jgi:hypothetical protein
VLKKEIMVNATFCYISSGFKKTRLRITNKFLPVVGPGIAAFVMKLTADVVDLVACECEQMIYY